MRLPWPFRRSAPDGGATASAAQGTVQPVMAPVRREWASTGDLRPSFVGDPGIRVQRFPDDIAGSQPPPPILAPLGHERTADGPAGLVAGLARPTLASVVHGSAGRADLPLRQRRAPAPMVQRAVAEEPPMAEHTFRAPAVTTTTSPPATAAAAADDAAVTGSPTAVSWEGLPALEVRRATVVPVAPPAARPVSLTVARTPDLTLATARGSTPSDPAIGTRQAQATLQAAAPSSALAALGTGTPTRTILRTASGSRVRLGPPIQRSVLERSAPALELAHPGRDATEASPATPIQRHAASDGASHDHAERGPDPAAPLVGGLSTTLGADPLASPAAREELTPGIPGGLVLARVVATGDDEVRVGPIQRASEPPVGIPAMVAPLAGTSSIAPSAGLRPTVPSPAGGTDPGTEPSGASARPAMTRGATRPPVQRAAPGDPGGPFGVVRPSPVPGALQRIARVSATGSGDAGPRPAAVGSASSAAAPALHLARTPSSTVAAAQDQRAARITGHEVSAPHLAVLRDTTDEAAPDQDAVEREAAGSTSTTGDSTTVASAPARAGASAGAGQIAERDLEEMVRRLYPRLRRSLSSELLVARERAGTLADLR